MKLLRVSYVLALTQQLVDLLETTERQIPVKWMISLCIYTSFVVSFLSSEFIVDGQFGRTRKQEHTIGESFQKRTQNNPIK